MWYTKVNSGCLAPHRRCVDEVVALLDLSHELKPCGLDTRPQLIELLLPPLVWFDDKQMAERLQRAVRLLPKGHARRP